LLFCLNFFFQFGKENVASYFSFFLFCTCDLNSGLRSILAGSNYHIE
jgi:hypothetical protein